MCKQCRHTYLYKHRAMKFSRIKVDGKKMIFKACGKCGKLKHRSKFNKDNARDDGVTPECRDCRRSVVGRKFGDVDINYKDVLFMACTQCGILKPIGEFYTRDNQRKIYYPFCKKCACDYSDKYRTVYSDNLQDQYIVKLLNGQTGLSSDDIYKHQEWIKAKRDIIKLHRINKQISKELNHESNKQQNHVQHPV